MIVLAVVQPDRYGAVMRHALRRCSGTSALATVVAAVVACTSGHEAATGEVGTPLRGLRPRELNEFHAGQVLFEKVHSPEEGLGPLFNENQCSACHTVPASGGTTGFERVVKATRFEGPNGCDLLTREGGENVRSQATPHLKSHGIDRQLMPPSAREVGRFTPPFLFGLGLIEAIPEERILVNADPDDADGDGISGRAGRARGGLLARFGRKADVATIRDFVESALHLEMGLTTPTRPNEGTIGVIAMPPGADPARDPEIDQTTVELLTAFVRFLNAPAPALPRSSAHNDTLVTGRRLFDELRCSACHAPSMRTGPSEVEALGGKTVPLYSDLLLHDMGPTLTSVCGPTATPAEMRTEMLMGLRHRDRLLHDGRTSDLREAILAHGGEAQGARDAFARLSWSRQEYVLKFLRSL